MRRATTPLGTSALARNTPGRRAAPRGQDVSIRTNILVSVCPDIEPASRSMRSVGVTSGWDSPTAATVATARD